MKNYIDLKHKYCKELLKKPNVVGVGVGKRHKQNEKTDEDSLTVFVSKKIPLSKLKQNEVVPRTVEGGAVDIIEIGEVHMLKEENDESESDNSPTDPEEPSNDQKQKRHNYPKQLCRKEVETKTKESKDRKKHHRPAMGGMSIGHYEVSAGTLGVAVRDKETGQLLALSNNHVLANSTTGKDGRAMVGDKVLQPGKHDGGRDPKDLWGYLERFIPLNHQVERPTCSIAGLSEKVANRILSLLSPHYQIEFIKKNDGENLVDAALARPLEESYLTDEILVLGRVAGSTEAYINQEVIFSGRSSGIRQGTLLATDASMMVKLGTGESLLFVDQLVTSALALPGDSGSLLLDKGNHAVGLVFAGSDRASICNRISNIIEMLQVNFN